MMVQSLHRRRPSLLWAAAAAAATLTFTSHVHSMAAQTTFYSEISDQDHPSVFGNGGRRNRLLNHRPSHRLMHEEELLGGKVAEEIAKNESREAIQSDEDYKLKKMVSMTKKEKKAVQNIKDKLDKKERKMKRKKKKRIKRKRKKRSNDSFKSNKSKSAKSSDDWWGRSGCVCVKFDGDWWTSRGVSDKMKKRIGGNDRKLRRWGKSGNSMSKSSKKAKNGNSKSKQSRKWKVSC